MSEAQRAEATLQSLARWPGAALRSYWVCALPFVATLGRFRNAFVFDDVFLIRSDFIFDLANLPRAFVSRTMIASSLDKVVGHPGMDTYRPLSIASFFWDAALSERSPWSYQLTNVLLHCGVCALLLALLADLLPGLAQRYRTALVAWFGLSPWLAEAHVWINGRSDLLLALWCLLALRFMRRALQEEKHAWSTAAGLCLLAGLLSKEVAVLVLPFVVAVPLASAPGVRVRLRYAAPLLGALVMYLALRYVSLSGLRTHNDAGQLALAMKQLPLLLLDGCAHILFPSPYFLRSLRDDYASLAVTYFALAWASVLVAVGLSLRYVRRAYTAVWGLLLALVALAPAALISTSLWPGFGRYLYLPAVGFSIALGAGLEAWTKRSARADRLAFLGLVSLTALSGLLLMDATMSFESDELLYGRASAERPQQAWALGFLGMSLRREQRCSEAIPYLERASQLAPDEPRYAIRLGQCLLQKGEIGAAQQLAERSRTRFSDTRAEAGFLMLAVRALPSSRASEQETLLRRCLTLDPERTDCAQLLKLLNERGSGQSLSEPPESDR
jgi:tetratricopeptide (TPR) repeat protein